MRGSNSSFDVDAIATKLKHIKQAWNVADVQELANQSTATLHAEHQNSDLSVAVVPKIQ